MKNEEEKAVGQRRKRSILIFWFFSMKKTSWFSLYLSKTYYKVRLHGNKRKKINKDKMSTSNMAIVFLRHKKGKKLQTIIHNPIKTLRLYCWCCTFFESKISLSFPKNNKEKAQKQKLRDKMSCGSTSKENRQFNKHPSAQTSSIRQPVVTSHICCLSLSCWAETSGLRTNSALWPHS